MKKPIHLLHILSNIDENNKMADCSICGYTIVRYKGLRRNKLTKKWSCRNQILAYEKINRPKRKFKERCKRAGLTTQAQIDHFLSKTNCECCLIHKDLVPLHMDHDHLTGQYRGALCFSCNSSIGRLGDSIEAITRALNYLKNSFKDTSINTNTLASRED